MKSVRLIALIALFTFASCASMFQGGPDSITIATHPPGADVFLDGVPVGKTPCNLTVTRRAGGQVMLKMGGYHDVAFRLGTKLNGTIVLNIFVLPIIGTLIDIAAGNGSAWQSPNTITMPPLSLTEPPSEVQR